MFVNVYFEFEVRSLNSCGMGLILKLKNEGKCSSGVERSKDIFPSCIFFFIGGCNDRLGVWKRSPHATIKSMIRV